MKYGYIGAALKFRDGLMEGFQSPTFAISQNIHAILQ